MAFLRNPLAYLYVALLSFASAAHGLTVADALRSSPSLKDLLPYEECVVKAIREYDLNPGAFLAILIQENGDVGKQRLNTNKTHDLGPAQVNTIWVDEFKKRNWAITHDGLQNDACLNVLTGGWIFRSELDRCDNDLWCGIGNYHSKDRLLQRVYTEKVEQRWNRLMNLGVQ